MQAHIIEPLKAIGPVRLGDSLNKIRSLGFKRNADLSVKNECYESDHLGLICYLEDHHVCSVNCRADCTINGKQLIGTRKIQILDILGKPERVESPVWVSDERYETCFDYDAMGLAIWLEDDLVVSVGLWWDGSDD
jgi:hypothetical protein